MGESEDGAARITDYLRRLVGASGMTAAAIDRRLGVGRGHTAKVVAGTIGLRVEDLLAILHAIEVEPGDFFRLLYPEKKATARGEQPVNLMRLVGLGGEAELLRQEEERAGEKDGGLVQRLAKYLAIELQKGEGG